MLVKFRHEVNRTMVVVGCCLIVQRPAFVAFLMLVRPSWYR